jgi:N-acylneuraminate cytidylyltransferase
MNIACFIFARGNSSGLKNKNILKFRNYSLISHSIFQAKKIKSIDEVYISTDSHKIQKIALKSGATIPFTRPKKLSTSKSPEILSWRHAINFFKKKKKFFDYIVSLPATSPLRSITDIKKCINLAIKNEKDFVFTVNKALRNPYFNMVKLNKKNKVTLICKNSKTFRRQDAPRVYDMNNACYVFKPNFILKSHNLFSGNTGFVIMPKNRSIDIDDRFDYRLCRILDKN